MCEIDSLSESRVYLKVLVVLQVVCMPFWQGGMTLTLSSPRVVFVMVCSILE